MRRLLLVLVLLGGGSVVGHAQTAPTDSAATTDEQDDDWLVLPFLGFGPTTGISGGMVAGYYQTDKRDDRGSSIQTSATVTQKRQLILKVAPELYLNDGRRRVQATLKARHFPDSFHGIGGNTPASAEESYTSRYVLADVILQQRVHSQLQVGPRLFVRAETITDPDSGGVIVQNRVPGADGGLTAGMGGAALWDARDSRHYPTTGTYADMRAMLHSAAWGSDYTFGKGQADVRGYRPLEWGVIAGQAYTEAVVGTAPFQVLPLLGGSRRMRGYSSGRLRDKVYWTVQAEYRLPLFWRLKGTAFASAGEVGPRVGTPLVTDVELAAGLGGRFRFTDGGVHGRLDVGYSRTGLKLYLGLGEAF